MQEVFEKIIGKLKEKSIYMTTRDGYGADCCYEIEKIICEWKGE